MFLPRPFIIVALALSFVPLLSAEDNAPIGDWPQWRGPQQDGHSNDTGLLKQWPPEGPSVLWKVDTVGVGYSSVAVKNGRLYTQGDLAGVEHVLCLDAKSGSLIWAAVPQPVSASLAQRVTSEMKNLDVNQDGKIDEVEALNRLGFDFNKFDKKNDGDVEALANARVERLFAILDANDDGKLTIEEAGQPFYNEVERIDQKDESVNVEELAVARAKGWIASFDQNGDAKIDRQESRNSIVDRMFRRVDQKEENSDRGDDLLSIAEIKTYFQQHEPGKDGVILPSEMRDYYLARYPGRDGMLTAEEVQGYFGGYRNGMGDGPRGTPTVDGDRVYTEGGNGDVTCMDAATGETNWHVNLSSDFGGGRPGWGYSESPLIDGELLYVTPGGNQGTVLALDKYTGQKKWQSDQLTEGAHYSTPVIADIHGVRTLVQFARESVFGVTADQGRLLWKYSGANNGTANCATPIVADDHVFVSSSYGTGGGLAQILQVDDGQKAEEIYFEKKMTNHHGGIVKVGEFMYGFGSSLLCMNFKTGDIAWQNRSVGKGSLTYADGMLYLLSENHEVALAEANPDEYREHGRFKIEGHGRPSWAHPVVTGGVLYIRDQQSLTAYNVRP